MRLKCKLSLCPHKLFHAGTQKRTWSGLLGHQYLVHFQCRTFHFLFSFLRVHKKHKNANKLISFFFPLRCFLSAFFIFVRLFAFCAFVRLRFGVFWCFFGAFCALCAFWCFLRVQNLFVKKKKFKTTFILLLIYSF